MGEAFDEEPNRDPAIGRPFPPLIPFPQQPFASRLDDCGASKGIILEAAPQLYRRSLRAREAGVRGRESR
jgi:hypothetical protein